MKAKQIAAAKSGKKAEAKNWKKAQLPYKKMLNALSGGMKDETNPAYDPRNNNCMCINGQLMLLDLIEHLEAVPGFELIQSNTDGLIIWIPDTDEAFEWWMIFVGNGSSVVQQTSVQFFLNWIIFQKSIRRM